jgi:predicted cytidylate kinase
MAIITISGKIGSGKTTLASKLERALGYKGLYIGHIFREMARKEGIPIEAFYARLEKDAELEKSVDEEQLKVINKEDNLIVQGRIAWFLAKQSIFTVFNIFLTVDPNIGALRSGKRKENAGRSVEEMIQANAAREATERKRYQALYGIENYEDPKHYDFVLDTSKFTEEELSAKVLGKIKERLDADV